MCLSKRAEEGVLFYTLQAVDMTQGSHGDLGCDDFNSVFNSDIDSRSLTM